MLNWIIWNRTDFLYKNGLGIKKTTKVDNPTNQPTKQPFFVGVGVLLSCKG